MDIALELAAAADHQDHGRLDEAAAIYQKILTVQREPYALYALGLIEQRRGHPANSAPLLHEAMALNPQLPNVHFHLAVALLSCGDLQNAVSPLREAAARAPERADLRNELGITLGRL